MVLTKPWSRCLVQLQLLKTALFVFSRYFSCCALFGPKRPRKTIDWGSPHLSRSIEKGWIPQVPKASHILPGSLRGVLQVSVCLVAFCVSTKSHVGVEEDESFESSHVWLSGPWRVMGSCCSVSMHVHIPWVSTNHKSKSSNHRKNRLQKNQKTYPHYEYCETNRSSLDLHWSHRNKPLLTVRKGLNHRSASTNFQSIFFTLQRIEFSSHFFWFPSQSRHFFFIQDIQAPDQKVFGP